MHAVSGKTVACHLTNEKLSEVQKWEWTDEVMERRLQSGEDIDICDRCIRLEYPDRNKIKVAIADIVFTSVINIDLGGVHCEIREFITPHSGDSVLVHVPEERIVFIGDADSGDYYENGGEYDKAKLKEMIGVLDKIDVDIFVSGHDLPESKLEVMSHLQEELDR
jgi:glyoxylase-like metal-dependent hydrolase (beta-lactamase superfamily II)